jgi:hypothetical protein
MYDLMVVPYKVDNFFRKKGQNRQNKQLRNTKRKDFYP